MDWLQTIILALIQGLTEFLPISSSAHLILPAQLTDWPDQGLAFDVALHVGSLAAVLLYYRNEVIGFTNSGWQLVTQQQWDDELTLLSKVVVATLPAVICGFVFKDWIEANLRTVEVIAATTIFFGLLLGFADRGATRHTASEYEMSWVAAILIGLAQALALIPGTSRSGITMTAALFLALSRTAAARFSFLLSIPTIAGGGLLLTLDILEGGAEVDWPKLTTAALLSGITAFLCIHYFIKLVERTGMMPYVIYRLLLGAVLLAFFI